MKPAQLLQRWCQVQAGFWYRLWHRLWHRLWLQCGTRGRPGRGLGAVLLLGLLPLLAACSLPRPEARPVTSYLLESSPPTAPVKVAARTCLTLQVARPSAAPGADTGRMAYVERAHELRYFAYNRWVEAPAQMLQPALVQDLAASALFRAVIGPHTRSGADLTLATELLRLRQVFDKGASRAELTVRVNLLDPAGQRLLASRLFVLEQPAPENTPYGGVLAANRALDELLAAIRAFLVEQLPAGAGCAEAPDAAR